MGTSNKSLYLYSLKVTGGGIQQEPSNGRIRGLNGHYVQRAVAGEGFSSRTNGLSVCTFGEMSYFIWEKSCLGLLVQSGANDCDHKMGKVRSALIQLKPANNAVVGQVFGDPSFRNAQVLGKLWLDGIRTSAT